jgi:hypothetical protein
LLDDNTVLGNTGDYVALIYDVADGCVGGSVVSLDAETVHRIGNGVGGDDDIADILARSN